MTRRAESITLRERAQERGARRNDFHPSASMRHALRATLQEIPKPMPTFQVLLKARSATGFDFTISEQVPADTGPAAVDRVKDSNEEALAGATVYHTSYFIVRGTQER